MEFTPNYVTLTNGETIAVYEHRQHKPLPVLLFIHGNLSSATNWFSTFNHLQKDFHLIAIDLRGFGMSTYRNKISTLSDFAQDVAEIIKFKNLTAVTLVGWSMGGGVALETAYLIPQRIKQIILLSSVGLKGYRELDFFNQLSTKFQWSNQTSLFNPLLHSMERLLLYRNRITIQRLLKKTLYTVQPLNTREEAAIIEQVMRQVNLSDVYKALINFNFSQESNGYQPGTNKVGSLTMPIQIWHGAHDQVVPLSEAQKTFKCFKDHATLTTFNHSGHAIMVDEPDYFYQSLLRLK